MPTIPSCGRMNSYVKLDYDAGDFVVYQEAFHFTVEDLERSYDDADEYARAVVDWHDPAAFAFFLEVFKWSPATAPLTNWS